ncbi:hypothetical protein PybrP1_004017 [[Pythium] brassicae (nom. inval.)]|nr:hypothetical protein PybrP1_004017 [[Pythium] brassicae (nom. inval.)]
MATGAKWSAAVATAFVITSADAALTTPFICASAEFQALPPLAFGGSPMTVRSLVKGDQVCLEFALTFDVVDAAGWFAVGLARAADSMVSSPPASVMLFQAAQGSLASYVVGGKAPSAVVKDVDQSGYVVGSMSLTAKSFSYQRTLAAATTSDVAIDVTKDATFIWAYGDSWPMTSGHRPGTRGSVTHRFAPEPQSPTPSGTTAALPATTTASPVPERPNATSDSPLDAGGRHNQRDTFLRAREPFCDGERNCPAIIGGAAFAFLLVCGLLATRVLAATFVGQALLRHAVASPPVASTTNRVVALPWTAARQMLADLYVGEVVVVATFVGAVVALAVLSADAHASTQATTGRVALLVLMFLLLPVAKVPLWAIFFGSSFERLVKFHRWLGVTMTVAVVVHLVEATQVVRVVATEQHGKVVPLFGFVAFLSFAAMALLANAYVRRVAFEVFYFSHRVLSVVGLVFAILHAPKIIGVALAVPLGFYVVGVGSQWLLSTSLRFPANVSAIRIQGKVAAASLVLRPSDRAAALAARIHPGAFFWVRLPSVSRTEWHPFSAVVTPDGKSVGFCVKAMDGKSFTRKLALEALQKRVLPVSLCGPFGRMALEIDSYDAVVVVAGGVGITPLLSLINQRRTGRADRKQAQDWFVVWSVRSSDHLLMVDRFMPALAPLRTPKADPSGSIQDPNEPLPAVGSCTADTAAAAVEAAPSVSWSFHVSSMKQDGSVTRQSGERLVFKAGRPLLQQTIRTERFKAGARVAVLASGPPTMAAEAQALARTCRFDFHKEVFNW